ncbi:membrane-spanning 4-domains subfamily A member 18 [Peromyscus californicus insignis]|uniref:membrane-spanning 4-domains subfamily A member 18 n=1 Tax=Peromyscus californicus insignis TaxID=564181 RepID=UPI0022A6B21C|nr:membrane-spanning 4-domains subfamily A member 18 [Peromyscus californicus insignis]
MNKEESVSAVNDPDNAHVTEPPYAMAPGSQRKPLERTTYQAQAKTLQYTGSGNSQNPYCVVQHPAGMTGLQAQPTQLPYSVGTADVQCSPEITTVPGPTQTSNHPQWNMSSMPFSEFHPKKFINEEVRTLGGIQIIIGLFHIVSAFNPELYRSATVLGLSGYLVWGGLSFIISGFLSVWAAKDPSSCLVSTNIGMNVISSIFSLLGIIIIIVDLCVSNSGVNSLTDCLKAISGGLLPFALLEFIITCMISHFGCQAACWPHFENMTMVSTMFSSSTVNTSNGPFNMTNGPVNTTDRPVYTTTNGPVYTTGSPVNMTNRPVYMTGGPVYTTDGPAHTTNGPVNSTSPDSDTNIPVPSNAPPGHSQKDRDDLDQE